MKSSNRFIVSTLTATLLACVSGYALAEQVSGTTTLAYTKQQPVPIANADGNVLMLNEAQGTNKSTSGNSFGDGASVTIQEVAQLFQGNGDDAGYFTVSNPDGVNVAKWSGHVTTVMKDGNPMTTLKGDWKYVSGTGKYAGIKGKGEYTGYFTSPTDYVVNWKGTKN
jgi:hypothetical protein